MNLSFIPMTDREAALIRFCQLGVHISWTDASQSEAFGIQMRDRSAVDDDLLHLQAFRNQLTVVGLAGTRVTDAGLPHLTDLPLLDNVDLERTAITDSGLEILGQIKSFEYIHVEGTQVTHVGISRLQTALPKCEICWDGN